MTTKYMEINTYLTYEERQGLIASITRYYRGGSKYKKKLNNTKDTQLLAMHQSMKERRLISGYSKDISIHLNIIMNDFGGADSVIVDSCDGGVRYYIGKDLGDFDISGKKNKIQFGYIQTDWRNVITDMELFGKKEKRYLGVILLNDWNYVK